MLLFAAIRGSNEHGFYSYSTPTVGKHIPRPKASTQTCLISIQTIQQMIPCPKKPTSFQHTKALNPLSRHHSRHVRGIKAQACGASATSAIAGKNHAKIQGPLAPFLHLFLAC